MQLSYDQYRIIKDVVQFNTQRYNRPKLDQDYMVQLNNAFDLMRMVLPQDQPIFMMAPAYRNAKDFQTRLNQHNRTSGRKVNYITNDLDLRGITKCVLIILHNGTHGRYADERAAVIEYVRSLPDHYHIDVWNIGEV